MPNPNVEALERLLSEAEAQVPGGRHAKLVSPIATRVLAQWLANRGVLVISDEVLTDEAVRPLSQEVIYDEHHTGPFLVASALVSELSRLAKGETT
jgi:hypothetical protein